MHRQNNISTLTRREFLERAAVLGFSASSIALLQGCGFLSTPTPTKIPRIGWLTTADGPSQFLAAFQQGLRELGYEEGKNILIEKRYSAGKNDRLPALAAELVALNVDVLVATSSVSAPPAMNASSTIPIVFSAADPVGMGLVASLAHPGGNATGLSTGTSLVDGKRLEILKDTIPGLSRVAVSWSPTNPDNPLQWRELQVEGKALGLQLQSLEYQRPEDFESAFVSALSNHPEALFSLDASGMIQLARIVEIAAKNRMPTSFKFRDSVDAGGLMSYGTDNVDMIRRLATFVVKILKGAKPADLPVEQPTKFDFVINLKTAKALGLTIPQSILAQATEVIQ